MLDKDIKSVLEKIKFIERYRDLSTNYQHNANESFENYDSDRAISIIKEFGYDASFNKKEKFFKIVETYGDNKFQFHISLKYGVSEFIWSAWKRSELKVGGTLGMLKEQLDGRENDKLRKPIFRNYEELKGILAEAFSIYEDFKRWYGAEKKHLPNDTLVSH
ncbi:hypothetical protein [Paenibacillus chitinolyticus]|uniref:hypothetical protein n=1 Tax=Paenibacillus chitinolyticus TaxID=79263 RepID=UPI003640A635